MKNTQASKPHADGKDDLRAEYDFDYTQARPNRFAGRVEPGSRIVALDPDIAEVFTTQEEVNNVLRALIATMPPTTHGTS
jgi:hypothetical protein